MKFVTLALLGLSSLVSAYHEPEHIFLEARARSQIQAQVDAINRRAKWAEEELKEREKFRNFEGFHLSPEEMEEGSKIVGNALIELREHRNRAAAHHMHSHSHTHSHTHHLKVAEDPPPPPCEGLTAKFCKPCPKGGDPTFCDNVKKQCAELFCRPMCLRITWECSIKWPAKLSQEKNDPKYDTALCGQFMAAGCQKTLKCCAEDDYLLDWVENRVYADQFPVPLFPSPSCLHDPKDPKAKDFCSNCKGIDVTLKAKKCPFPDPDNTAEKESKAFLEEKAVVAKLSPLEEEEEEEVDMEHNEKFLRLFAHSLPEEEKSFVFTELLSSLRDKEKMNALAKMPAFKSVQARCLAFMAKLKPKLASMKPDFKSKACGCLGCCKGECFYPMTIIEGDLD